MALKDFSSGDYDSTIARKILQNQRETMGGTLVLSVTYGSATGAVQDYQRGDNDEAVARKILQNEAAVIRGTLAYAVN